MGHLASTYSIAGSPGFRMKPELLSKNRYASIVFLLLSLTVPTVVIGQSGRNTDKAAKPSPAKRKPVAEPAAEPAPSRGTPVSNSQTPTRDSRPRKISDETDPSDTVRVSSNLVPIPASV